MRETNCRSKNTKILKSNDTLADVNKRAQMGEKRWGMKKTRDAKMMEKFDGILACIAGKKFTIHSNIDIDWVLLCEQKQALLRAIGFYTKESYALQGILTLIDAIQDAAAESENWTEQEIFGDLEKEDNIDNKED